MSLSLHDISVPVFIRAFRNLSEILEKGRAFADQNKIPHSELLEARLYPDMAPLTGQIQRASDTASPRSTMCPWRIPRRASTNCRRA